MNFEIKTEPLSDHAFVVSLAGEVDLYVAPELKQQLLEVDRARRDSGDRRPHGCDVRRLDDARRADRRRAAPAGERRPALGRLQRPQRRRRPSSSAASTACSTIYPDARAGDRAARRRAQDLRLAMRASSHGPESRRTRPTRARLSRSRVAVAFLTAGCGAVAHMTATEGDAHGRQGALQGRTAARATRWRTPGRPAYDRAEPRRRPSASSAPRASTSRRSATSSAARSPTPRPRRPTGGPGMPANLVDGPGRRRRRRSTSRSAPASRLRRRRGPSSADAGASRPTLAPAGSPGALVGAAGARRARGRRPRGSPGARSARASRRRCRARASSSGPRGASR